MPSGSVHFQLGRIAWRSLSDEDRRFVGIASGVSLETPEFLAKEFDQSAQFGAEPDSEAKKMGIYSLFGDAYDWLGDQYRRRYPEYLMPDGRTIPHGPPAPDGSGCLVGEDLPDVLEYRKIFSHFLPILIDHLRGGRHELATCFLGRLWHFLQDGSSPAHVLPNVMFYRYSPALADRHLPYHTLVDAATPEAATVRPGLLGRKKREL